MYKWLSMYFWRSHLVEALDVFSAFRMQSPLVTRRGDARSIVRSCACLPIIMENLRTQEMPDYVRRHKLRVRMVVAIFICVTSLIIILWFVSSFMENKRGYRQKGATGGELPDEIAHLQRLSDQILPLEYTLKILPMLEEENFTTIGDVEIQFYCVIPTKHVRFHARNLLIEDLSVKEYSSNSLKLIKKYVATPEDDFIDVFLLQMLFAGQIYVLHITYTTPLRQKAEGLFRSSYIDGDGEKTRWIAVSNFSPNYARTAYPCFDEPWIKTPFRISIGRKSDMRSHSNSMFRVTEEIHNMPGYVWDHYVKTVPMPTYLVALMVTDFFGYDVNVDDRPSHTIFSRKEFVNNTKYIGDLIPKALRFIQNFTTFSCKLDKVDVIAVPDLSYSAMENSGLITFREDAITIKEGKDITLPDSKKVVANIAAHEVAHQWFGNLVTPKWWDDVWLKEGFSTFFGYLALNAIEPASWDLQMTFLMDCHDVFNNDADQTAHPLHIDLRKLNGLVDVFDLTSYVKGNCMARMIYHFLDERIFFESVRRYIRTYYYRSADQEDLWSAFQMEIDGTGGLPASPRLDMSDVMKTWTYQAGFPVLHVQQNRETGVIELKQDRFYYYGLNSMSKELWHIPLTWTTENEQQFGNAQPKAWMVEKRMKINDIVLNRASSSNQWILFNINQTALYRVNYDAENWKLLTRSFETLPEVAKVQLLTDSFAMVDAGLLDKIIMWRILEKLEAETGEMLWTLAIPLLTTIHDRLWKSSAFEFVMCKFIDKVYNRVAPSLVSKDPILWTGFELRLMKSACLAGNRACLSIARNFAHKLLRNKTSKSVSEEFRRWTYCIFMKVATEEQWLALFDRYNGSAVNDKENLAFALGCHVNATLLQKYLFMMFSQENVTFSHIDRILTSVMLNPHGFNVAKEFLPQYWDKFNTNADNVRNVTLTDTLRVFVRRIRQEEDVERLRRLIGKSEKYNVEIEQVIYRVQANVAWYKKNKNETQKIVEMISAKLAETKNCKR